MDDFIKTMSNLELVVMRHEAKKVNDTQLVKLIDEELRIREDSLMHLAQAEAGGGQTP